MPHHHHHDDHCGHEAHDHDHNHDHDEPGGPKDNLYIRIDRPNVVALNADGEGPEVIKPWDKRLDEGEFLESDADDQMIIRVPFTGSVKLRAVLIKSGPAGQTPSKVLLYANENNLDFSDTDDKKATQEFVVAQGREVGEYSVMPAKFSNISCITLFFPSSQGTDTTRIYYVGFLGSWSERKQNPVITVYEAQPNLADHEKIQGMDGNLSTPQL